MDYLAKGFRLRNLCFFFNIFSHWQGFLIIHRILNSVLSLFFPMHRQMTTLNSAMRGLNMKRNNLEARIWWFSLIRPYGSPKLGRAKQEDFRWHGSLLPQYWLRVSTMFSGKPFLLSRWLSDLTPGSLGCSSMSSHLLYPWWRHSWEIICRKNYINEDGVLENPVSQLAEDFKEMIPAIMTALKGCSVIFHRKCLIRWWVYFQVSRACGDTHDLAYSCLIGYLNAGRSNLLSRSRHHS